MAVTQFKPEEQNPSAAPTLGMSSGVLGQGVIPGQGREVSSRQKGSGRFTNLQSYIKANEPESGGLNPNARLVQQRAEQAGSQLGQRQSEFTQGLEPIRSGLQGIQERANVAQSAFQDPTKFVQSPENLKRFRALRTGQENIPDVTQTYGQIEPLRQGLTSEQRNIAEGLRTDVGQNLQNYIRSQRLNPSLATLGEMQLDKFLTTQTPSGQAAIESAITRAGQIESEQTPAQERLAQLATLRSQLAENPLVTQAGIMNRLGTERRLSEQDIRNVTPGYLQEKVGLSGNKLGQAENQKNLYVTTSNQINQLKQDQSNTINAISDINQFINNKNNEISNMENELKKFKETFPYGNPGRTPQKILWNGREVYYSDYVNELENNIRNSRQDIENNLYNRSVMNNDFNKRIQMIADKENILNNSDFSLIPSYDKYINQLTNTRQQILQQYDPATLARIQALGQLSEKGFEDMLGARIS